MSVRLEYPAAPREDTELQVHGVSLPEPYRWLEDVDSEATQSWLATQSALLTAALARVPDEAVMAVYAQHGALAVRGAAVRGGAYLFFVAGTEQSDSVGLFRLRVSGDAGGSAAPERLELPLELTPAAEHLFPSPSGRYVAVGMRAPGAEAMSIAVIDAQRNEVLPDGAVPAMLPALAWRPDETGYYYNVVQGVHWMHGQGAPVSDVRFHRLGTVGEHDTVVLKHEWNGGEIVVPWIDERGRHLVLLVVHLFTGHARVLAMSLAGGAIRPLLSARSSLPRAFAERDGEIFFVDTADARRGAIIAVSTEGDRWGWSRVVVPEQVGEIKRMLSACAMAAVASGDRIAVVYQWGGRDEVSLFDFDGRRAGAVGFPVPVDVLGVEQLGAEDRYLAITVQGHVQPPTIVRADVTTGAWATLMRVARVTAEPPAAEPFAGLDDLVIEQEWMRSADGTRVPVTLVRRADLALDGTNRCLLAVYGGIGVTYGPKYSPEIPLWVRSHGFYAIVHARGGGEFGEEWHKAGMFEAKPNTFLDLRAAAEHLIVRGYTRPDLLVCKGKSLGGLTMGYAYNEYAHLFAGVIADMPLLDVINTVLAPHGTHMRHELGDIRHDEAAFRRLLSYSPVHNLRPAECKPALLVICGAEDKRVLPGWLYKYVATAQDVAREDQLVLLMRVAGAGHTALDREAAQTITLATLRFALLATGGADSYL